MEEEDITNERSGCDMIDCVYNEFGMCDEPQINHGNSDALCFEWKPRELVDFLTSADEDE